LTASEYNKNGLPWFEYYDDSSKLSGFSVLKKLKSVIQMGQEKGDNPLPKNETVVPDKARGFQAFDNLGDDYQVTANLIQVQYSNVDMMKISKMCIRVLLKVN
jgi:hypothetical protein